MGKIIAVLLPVYKNDRPDYFKESLNSVLAQSYPNTVVLIGVDGPIGGELEQVLLSLETNNKIEVLYFKTNRGLACVLNDLISRAREIGASYLARMDADDICSLDRFEIQLNFMESHPEIDVVGGRIEEIDECGNNNGKFVAYPASHEDCRRFFRYRDPLAHPATFFRLRFFDKVKGYRPEYRKNQDTMLWYDGFLNGCQFSNVPDTVLSFRVSPDFYKRRNGLKRAKQMLKDRFVINKSLGYDISSYLFAVAMFCMTISPIWLKKFLYRIR